MARKSNEDLVKEFLAEAEKRYGPRVADVTFEVQENADGPLHSDFNASTNHVIIRLPAGLNEFDRRGALAQESVHVLSPATPNEATVFDIGLATFFAKELLSYRPGDGQTQWKYGAALALMECLNGMCPGVIGKLRSAQPRVALILEKEIIDSCPRFPEPSAHFLVQPVYVD